MAVPAAPAPPSNATRTYLSPTQQKFITGFVQESGLNPSVAAAWLRNEEPKAPTNTDPAGHGAYNFMNIGITGSGSYGADSSFWKDPTAAGKATAQWMKGDLSIPGFGKSIAPIQAIFQTAGQTPQQQIHAIQTSGWAGGHPGAVTENAMPGLYNDMTGAGGVQVPDAATTQAVHTAVRTAVHTASGALPPNSPPVVAPTDSNAQRASLLQYLMQKNTGAGHQQGAPTLLSLMAGEANPASTPAPAVPLSTKLIKSAAGTSTPIKLDPNVKPDASTAAAIKVAEKYLGTAYHFGGANPATGFDCSGLLQYAYAQAGVKIPRVTGDQIKAGTPVPSTKDLKPGDAIFFNGGEHVGMYIGNGNFIQAPHTGDVVKISKLAGYDGGPFAMRRYA